MCACVKHNSDTMDGGRDVVSGVISCLWRGYDEKIMFCVYRVKEKCNSKWGKKIRKKAFDWELFK